MTKEEFITYCTEQGLDVNLVRAYFSQTAFWFFEDYETHPDFSKLFDLLRSKFYVANKES